MNATDGTHGPGGRRRRRRVIALALVAAGAVVAGLVLLLTGGGPTRHPRPLPRPIGPPTPVPPAPTTTAPVSTTPPAPGPPALPPPASPSFGVNVNRLFNDGTYSAAQIDQQLAAARSAGVRVARTDAFWEATELAAPSGGVHHYDWSFDDRLAAALAKHGIEWLALLDYSAAWAASVPGNDHSPPRASSDYATFAGTFAARYGRGGEFWREHPEVPYKPVTTFEIWNEPDSMIFWAPAPDPARYIDLYLRARDSIKLADSQARVLVGGLTDAPRFLSGLLGARPDARGHVDGVALHPYNSTPLGVLAKIADARKALDAVGLEGAPLYATEFDWATSPPTANWYASVAVRPGYIAKTIDALGRVDCGVAGVLIYTWVTPERDPANQEDWYGIYHPDGTPSPSSVAFADVLHHLDRLAHEPPIRLCGPPGRG